MASRLVAVGLAGAFSLAGCGGDPATGDAGRTYFAESDSRVYAIRSLGAHFDQFDERVSLGSAANLVVTPGGYLVADGLNRRLVLFDRRLDPVRIIGREGNGPGEYQFPGDVAWAGERILVLDGGNGRVSYLSQEGDFLTSQPVPGNAVDIAEHPELGLLVAGDAFPGHYLARVTARGNTPFGRVPDELRIDAGGAFRWPVDLVAVTADGVIHILDGDQLALVSFLPDGDLVGVVFLPSEMRDRAMKRAASETLESPWAERSLGVQIVMDLSPLGDGRLFARITSDETIGLVLDPARLEAVPLVIPPGREDWRWMRGSMIGFDGMDRVVLSEGPTVPGLRTAQVELVAREE